MNTTNTTGAVEAGAGLLPCPFCGRAARQVGTGLPYWKHRVECTNCFCRTDNFADGHESAMVAYWNRRRLADPQSLSGDASDLHARILALPDDPGSYKGMVARVAYRDGHRNARCAAAELAAATEARVALLEAENADLRTGLEIIANLKSDPDRFASDERIANHYLLRALVRRRQDGGAQNGEGGK